MSGKGEDEGRTCECSVRPFACGGWLENWFAKPRSRAEVQGLSVSRVPAVLYPAAQPTPSAPAGRAARRSPRPVGGPRGR